MDKLINEATVFLIIAAMAAMVPAAGKGLANFAHHQVHQIP